MLDSFETIVLPRTVKRPVRLTNLVFRLSRTVFWAVNVRCKEVRRQTIQAAFAPVTLFLLIIVWAVLIIFGYACLSDGLDLPFRSGPITFLDRLYFSGVTFFTLGYGDLVPVTGFGKLLAVIEAGTGFAFLGVVIGYVPVLYNAFARREVTMLLLDSKAGSDPTGSEILRRHAQANCMEDLIVLLKEWETFAAQQLEVYLSYPILASYRSQHDDQSWLRSLTAVMDACALISGGFAEKREYSDRLAFQCKATFAMARHLVVDFAYVIGADPETPKHRQESELPRLFNEMEVLGFKLDRTPEAARRFEETRSLYDPFVEGLSRRLLMDLPDWIPPAHELDNWQTSAWDGKHF